MGWKKRVGLKYLDLPIHGGVRLTKERGALEAVRRGFLIKKRRLEKAGDRVSRCVEHGPQPLLGLDDGTH